MGVIDKQLDNISSKQQIKACHCSADDNVADYAETQAFSHSLIVLSAVAVADKRLNTLTETDLKHNDKHICFHCNSHCGNCAVTVFDKNNVNNNIAYAHKKTVNSSRKSYPDNAFSNSVPHSKTFWRNT